MSRHHFVTSRMVLPTHQMAMFIHRRGYDIKLRVAIWISQSDFIKLLTQSIPICSHCLPISKQYDNMKSSICPSYFMKYSRMSTIKKYTRNRYHIFGIVKNISNPLRPRIVDSYSFWNTFEKSSFSTHIIIVSRNMPIFIRRRNITIPYMQCEKQRRIFCTVSVGRGISKMYIAIIHSISHQATFSTLPPL